MKDIITNLLAVILLLERSQFTAASCPAGRPLDLPHSQTVWDRVTRSISVQNQKKTTTVCSTTRIQMMPTSLSLIGQDLPRLLGQDLPRFLAVEAAALAPIAGNLLLFSRLQKRVSHHLTPNSGIQTKKITGFSYN